MCEMAAAQSLLNTFAMFCIVFGAVLLILTVLWLLPTKPLKKPGRFDITT